MRQRLVCTFGPKHVRSIPSELKLLIHERVRVWMPRPHELLHRVQPLHDVNPMSFSPWMWIPRPPFSYVSCSLCGNEFMNGVEANDCEDAILWSCDEPVSKFDPSDIPANCWTSGICWNPCTLGDLLRTCSKFLCLFNNDCANGISSISGRKFASPLYLKRVLSLLLDSVALFGRLVVNSSIRGVDESVLRIICLLPCSAFALGGTCLFSLAWPPACKFNLSIYFCALKSHKRPVYLCIQHLQDLYPGSNRSRSDFTAFWSRGSWGLQNLFQRERLVRRRQDLGSNNNV